MAHLANVTLRLSVVRLLHTLIFAIMASAVFYVDYCGLVGRTDWVFYSAVGLIVLEGIVFFGNGAKCPLTDLAQKYGAQKGYVFDTFFPEKWTRYTVPVYTTLFMLGLLLWTARQLF